ncbi:hypothetical protein [Longimicrobium sp.]|uniref:hypothetical protein n=1 Tax=Longimicrobium sp. TaxID=2029185 RepID=UPI002EDBB6AE
MTAEGATPLSDRVLRDPLAVPQGLESLLRGVERDARREHARMAALAARPNAIDAVRASAADIHAFLHDELGSPLHRTLRRPLRQVAPGSAAAKNLDQARRWLVSRAARAATLQAEIDVVRGAVVRLRDRFAAEMPRATQQALERARASEAHLARLRRAEDAEPLHERLRAAERELERLQAHVPGTVDEWQPGASWSEEASLGELLAALELRLRERAPAVQEQGRRAAVQRLTVRHVVELARAAPAGTAAGRDVHVAAEQAALSLVRGHAQAHGSEDLPLWAAVLGGASDAVYGGGEFGWAPQLPPPAPAPDTDPGSTRFVVPIDETYVLITVDLRSSVRVRDRRIALDKVVECAAFSPEGEADTLALARLDVQPLFAGFSPVPGWYATETNARLQVIAEAGDRWIARVVRKGALRRSRTPGWVPDPPARARLRVLGSLAEPSGAEPIEVGRQDRETRVFCGLETTRVDLPFVDCAVAWLRSPGHTAWSGEALAAEEEVFRAISRRVPFTVPRAIGPGRYPGTDTEGVLYVPPFGARLDESPPMETWLRASYGRAQLGAAARLWTRVNKAGYALGVYHLDAMVFRTGWSPPGGFPTAHAVATDAPYGCVLGQYYRRPPADPLYLPRYAGLGGHVLPPGVAQGEVALPECEAQAFALFALDVLASRPLPLSPITPALELAAMLPDFGNHFVQPALVRPLAEALVSCDAAGRIIEWIAVLAQR